MKKIFSLCLSLLLVFALTGCGEKTASKQSETNSQNQTVASKEFSFSLTWGCYGTSSYNSETGKLVKTTDATNPENYVTQYMLTDEDKEYIYDLLESLDINSYPEVYNPNANAMSTPSMTLILSASINGTQKTIKSENISLSFESNNKKGQKFLSVCEAIIDRLIQTEEWKALPEYEFLYS